MTTLEMTWLRSLVAVASFAGVRRAAETLHLSQAAVSGHLRRLESELGFAVVTRQGRNIAFTVRGEEVVREAHRLLAAHDDAVERLVGPEADVLTIASTEQASEPMLQAVERALVARCPDRPVRLRLHRTARVREVVHEHAADVALGFGDLGPGTVPVGDVPLVWLASPEVAPAPLRLVTFSPPCMIRDRILGSDVARHATVERECLDLTSLLTAVRRGVGVTALPRTVARPPGVEPLTGLPPLPAVRLSLVAGPRVDDQTRREVLASLRAAWTEG